MSVDGSAAVQLALQTRSAILHPPPSQKLEQASKCQLVHNCSAECCPDFYDNLFFCTAPLHKICGVIFRRSSFSQAGIPAAGFFL